MHHVQYHEVVRLGHTLFMHAKVDTQEWTEFLTEHLVSILGGTVFFLLMMSKINYGTTFKYGNKVQFRTMLNIKNIKNMGVHVETIKLQHVKVKRALEKVLSLKITKDRHVIDLMLVLQMRYDFETKQK